MEQELWPVFLRNLQHGAKLALGPAPPITAIEEHPQIDELWSNLQPLTWMQCYFVQCEGEEASLRITLMSLVLLYHCSVAHTFVHSHFQQTIKTMATPLSWSNTPSLLGCKFWRNSFCSVPDSGVFWPGMFRLKFWKSEKARQVFWHCTPYFLSLLLILLTINRCLLCWKNVTWKNDLFGGTT
jgi:hypothetical protein